MNTIILKHCRKLSKAAAAVVAVFLLISAGQALGASRKTVAVLPFDINSDRDISHIQEGIRQMFYSRLTWKDTVTVASKKEVMPEVEENSGLSGKELSMKVGRSTGYDYVISGSVTEFEGAFSIDARILDVASGRFIPFYTQASKMEEIIPELDLIAARINKDVFNRETRSYAKIEKKKTESEERLRRMNPEKMIPYRQRQGREEDKPIWMFWKFWD
ncbi:MAG: hypothetical protein R6V41_06285 [Desulfobacteraceae bacterium]